MAQKSELYLAVDAQDLTTVKTELAKGAKVNEKVEGGFTSLYIAAGLNDKEIVVLLVEHGADVKAESDMGFGVIHRAAMTKNPEILKYIISKGGDVNHTIKSSCSPFHFFSGSSLNVISDAGTITINDFSDGDLGINLSETESIDKKEITKEVFLEEDFYSPLVLDLNANGINSTRLNESSVYFDMDGDGFKERTAWVENGDGLLVLDKNANGTIDNGSELFGNFTALADGNNADDGFSALLQHPRSQAGAWERENAGDDYLDGGEGFDTYITDNGDKVYDQDGIGHVEFYGMTLTGGTQMEGVANTYEGNGGVYTLNPTNKVLTFTKNGTSVEIHDFDKANNELGIVLEDSDSYLGVDIYGPYVQEDEGTALGAITISRTFDYDVTLRLYTNHEYMKLQEKVA